MKKIIALLLILCFAFSLTACKNSETTSDTTDSVNVTIDSEPDSTESEATASDETESTASDSKDTDSSKTDSNKDGKPANSVANSSGGNKTNSSATSNESKTDKPSDSTASHTHSYSKATCTEAAKCSCGATQGASLGHKWTAATCTTKKTCSVCKATEGETAAHKYVNHKCTVCKANESGYTVVESTDKTFSVILPEALANKCTIEAYSEKDGVQISVKNASLGMYAENVPVFIFTSVHSTETTYEEDWKKKGDGLVFDQSSFNTLEGMGFRLKKTSHSKDGFTIYCQYIDSSAAVSGNSAVVKELLNNESKIEIVFN